MSETELSAKVDEQADDAKSPWEDDLLGRQEDADFLYSFLVAQSSRRAAQTENRSYVINIDAKWGDGKTFFLTRFRQQLSRNGHIAVYVNAWSDDFADDPLTAVMAAIDDEVQSHAKPDPLIAKAWSVAKSTGGKVAGLIAKGLAVRAASFALTAGVATAVADAVASGFMAKETGVSVQAQGGDIVSEAIKTALDETGTEAVSDFLAMKKSIVAFRSSLATFVNAIEKNDKIPSPFFVLIDELDRCRPPYAIAMLERIKHLFDVPGVVFLIATDSAQLAHAVGAVYGSKFDSKSYLTRFFDRTYLFQPPTVDEFVEYLIAANDMEFGKTNGPLRYSPSEFMKMFFGNSDLSLRSIAQVFDIICTISQVWKEPVKIELLLMLPLAVAFHRDPKTIEKLGSDPHVFQGYEWTLSYHRRIDAFSREEMKVSASELMKTLWDVAQSDLNSAIKNNQSDDPINVWLHEVCWAEYNVRYNGKRVMPGSPSVMARYSSFVRQAGKVTNVALTA